MGQQNTICSHKNILYFVVSGSKEINYEDVTSYKDTFAHFKCPDCKLNCFRKRSYYYSIFYGQTPSVWENWVPKDESETIKI